MFVADYCSFDFANTVHRGFLLFRGDSFKDLPCITLLHPFRKRAFEQNYPGGPFHYGPSDWSKIIQEGIGMSPLQSSEVALKLKDFPTKDQTDQMMCLMSGT